MERYKRKLNEKMEVTEELLDQIDWKKLEKEIAKRIGTKITLEREIIRGRINAESKENYVDKSGIFKAVLKSARVGTFNSDTGEDYWWATWNISFDIKDGGSNGISLMTTWWRFKEKKWDIRDV